MAEKLISESIGALLVQICKAHRNKAQELLSRIDLYPGQEFLLINLWPEDGLTHSEVAESLCVQPATVTKMLDRLVRTGLVQRQQDSNDQRVSRVYLTEKGRQLLQPIQQVWNELEQISFANLTLEERLLLRRILTQVYENLGGSD
ncbi:MAG: transcriptional regulator [Chloroflexi bacterium RBG_16_52_11]|nr:MAG: transcriptional regulator [Chloroflexi bacterium RBG_16_52_11]